MKTNNLLLFLVLCFLMVANQFVNAGDPSGAKALFYSGEGTTISHTTSKTSFEPKKTTSASTSQKYMGIAYWIDKLGADGQVYRASASSTFRGGDRIKLYIQTNRDGYLYVYNIGTSGMTNVLFPSQNTPDNYVRAYQPIAIPQAGFIRFDFNPGSEKVLVMLSPNPINLGGPAAQEPPPSTTYSPSPPSSEPPSYPPSSNSNYVDNSAPSSYPPGSSQYASNNIPDAGSISYDKSLNDAVSKIAIGAKDLFVEESAPTGKVGGRDMVVESDAPLTRAMPATYVVAPTSAFEGGRLISLELNLRHK